MTKTYKFLLLAIVTGMLFLSSCELYNPAEPIPAYIHIQKFNLIRNTAGFATAGDEGTLSHKITDAWVYIDDKLIGCFELPATFPVQSEGIHQVKIRAGIKVNGIASNRSPYPFFSMFNQQITLEAGKTIALSPTVNYLSTTSFPFMEDFETPGSGLTPTSISDTTLQVITSPPDPNVFEGSNSGIAYADASHPFFECATVNKYSLPTGGAPIFLEFNYKSNYPFTVSTIAYGSSTSSQFTALHMNPSAEWNKAYIYLTPTVSGAFTAINYKFAWGMLNSTGQDSAAVLLDNIKLIY